MKLLVNTKNITIQKYKGEDIDKLNPSINSCEVPYYYVVDSDDFVGWFCDFFKNADSTKNMVEYMIHLLDAAKKYLDE